MPVARELHIETRQAPILCVSGTRGAHDPARFGGARCGGRAQAQKKRRHVLARGRQHKPPAGGETQNLRLAHNLDDDGAETAAREGIGRAAQHVQRIGDTHQDQTIRIKAELQQSGGAKLAMFERSEILSHP